jgi:flagellar basal body-associated protein FliL
VPPLRVGKQRRMSILWIILIVLLVLLLFGGIGYRGRRY